MLLTAIITAACNDIHNDKSNKTVSLYHQSTDSHNNSNLTFAEDVIRKLDKNVSKDSNVF